MSDRELRIRVLMQGADRLTRPMRDAAAGSTRLAQTLKATRDRLKDLNQAQANVASFRQLKAGLGETKTKLEAARTKATALGRQLAQTEQPAKALQKDFERARREVTLLSNQFEQQGAKLARSRAALREAGRYTRNLASDEIQLRNDVRQANDSLREQERRLEQVARRQKRMADARARFSRVQGMATGLSAGGLASIGTGMALAAPLKGAADDAMEFESAMTDINQKVNQSRDAGRAMGLELLKAGLAVNQFPRDLQKGVDTLTGFGLDAQTAVDMMRPIGQAATAYKAEIDDLSKASFAAYDNLKVPIEQTGNAIDVMAQAGKSGKFEIRDMAQYFPELTANMQSLGSKGIPAVADLAAALQITSKGAGDSAGAATNLQNLLSKINAGDTIKHFKKFGVDVPNAIKKAASEGRSPIEEIVRLTQQVTGGDQAKLSSLFGDMQVQQALRPLMSNFKEYQQIRAEALGAQDVVKGDFADRMQDRAEKVKHVRIQAQDLSVTLGNQLNPVTDGVTDRFSDWGNKLAILVERHPKLTRAVAIGAAVFAGLFLVLGGAAIVLAGLVAPFAILSATATALGIGMLPLIGIVAGVVIGVGLLAGAAYLIYANWGKISEWFGSLWAGIKGFFNSGIDNITATMASFSPERLLYAGFTKLVNWLGISMPAQLSGLGSDMIHGLINGILGRTPAVKQAIAKIGQMLPDGLRKLLGIHSPSRVFAQIGGHVMAGLDHGLAANASGPLSRITDLSGQMTRALSAGAIGTAMATASPAAAAAASAATPPPVLQATYHIHITAGAGASANDIADEVRKALEAIENERRGRGFGDE